MVDYSKLSDFEINKRVALVAGKNIKFISVDVDDNEVGIIVGQKHTRQRLPFDPCNNPYDAWPIIFENKIMLSPRCADDEWKAEIYLGREDIFDNYASAWHKNPLRAAMIVFLMMQEGE